MRFFILGVSHQRAPVEVREKFALPHAIETGLKALEAQGLRETLILSTCNRAELLAVADRAEEAALAAEKIMGEISGLTPDELSPLLHRHFDLDAARHLFRVAAGLESQMLGESQILGQVKAAFRAAVRLGRAGPLLHKLLHRAFRAAKRARSETGLAGGAVSVAGAAAGLARQLMGAELDRARAVVLGAGSMAALALDNLKKRSRAELVLLNRTQAKAELLAARLAVPSRPWAELPAALTQADLVIAATAAETPLLTAEKMSSVLAARSGRPLLIIDIGAPRNVAHDVKRLPGVTARNIDDLNEAVGESRLGRSEAAARAEAVVEDEVGKFAEWLDRLPRQPTLAALTRKAEAIRRLELEKTLSQHSFDPEQLAALEAMTSALVRRLLHDPLAFIKNSAAGSPCPAAGPGCLNSIRRAFNLQA